jgi:hypothetical protein
MVDIGSTHLLEPCDFRRGAVVSVKIFISCVSDEFRVYRDQLRTDLTRHNVEVKVQEDFKDYGVPTVVSDDIYISTCDAVVHLAGDMTGAMAQPASTQAILDKYPDIIERFPPVRALLERGEEISYTQWEAWLALYHGKPLLIAQAGEAAPRGPAFVPSEASRAAQRAHLDRLRALEHYPGCMFVSADQLAKYVLASPVLDLLAKERADAATRGAGWFPAGSLLIGTLGLLILLITPMAADQWAKTLGVRVAAPLALVLAVACFALPLVYSRYFIMLGASDAPPGSRDRKGYDDLRENLATGGAAVRLYSRWLTAFLDRVDRFFGDAGMEDRTLFPHAFGLRTLAPLWTAPALDRCFLLALIYPFVTILIMWAASGHVGPAEEAMAILPNLSGWKRGIIITAAALTAFAMWWYTQTTGKSVMLIGLTTAIGLPDFALPPDSPRSFFALLAVCTFGAAGAVARSCGPRAAARSAALNVAGAVLIVFAAIEGIRHLVGASGYGGAMIVAVSATGVATGRGAVAVAVALAVGVVSPGIGELFIGAIAVAIASIVASVNTLAIRNQWEGVFLLVLLVVMVVACLASASFLSATLRWDVGGPVLLFGLLTMLNAPFDWASLGLTRALLRRGLELKGWWPFLLALADALCAAVIVALLALTMVIGVQTFNALTVHNGHDPILRVVFDTNLEHILNRPTPLLLGIAFHPAAPEYWWVYALLLSTMIPSLINLVIGGTALMRAVPGLSSALLHRLPATGGVPTYDRAWIAAVLTVQAALGAILGVAVQALVAWGLIFYAMPAAGLGLLDLARGLAKLDLPMRLVQFLAGTS